MSTSLKAGTEISQAEKFVCLASAFGLKTRSKRPQAETAVGRGRIVEIANPDAALTHVAEKLG
jgi:hypothetical protein